MIKRTALLSTAIAALAVYGAAAMAEPLSESSKVNFDARAQFTLASLEEQTPQAEPDTSKADAPLPNDANNVFLEAKEDISADPILTDGIAAATPSESDASTAPKIVIAEAEEALVSSDLESIGDDAALVSTADEEVGAQTPSATNAQPDTGVAEETSATVDIETAEPIEEPIVDNPIAQADSDVSQPNPTNNVADTKVDAEAAAKPENEQVAAPSETSADETPNKLAVSEKNVDQDTQGAEAQATPSPSASDLAVTSTPEPASLEINAVSSIIEVALDAHASDFGQKSEFAAASAFYEAGSFKPLWLTKAGISERAETVLSAFETAETMGLDPADYALSVPDDMTAEAAAGFDIMLTAKALRYARHAYTGKVKPSALGRKNVDQPGNQIAPEEVLEEITSVTDIASYMDSLHPSHPQFLALLKEYARLMEEKRNGIEADEGIVIPDGKLIKSGRTDDRVALLRQRLEVDAGEQPNVYDKDVEDAVKDFQKSQKLTPDGVVGPATIRALNGGPKNKLEVITANLERWRWAPREFGKTHVLVNVPFYKVYVQQKGEEVYQGRVVVGTKKNRTTLFSDVMEHIVVNPYWNVPSSIASQKILPQIRRNPAYASAFEVIPSGSLPRKVRVENAGFFRKKQVVTNEIDWAQVSAGQVRFRQPPGPRNALGTIKFLFPNKHAIYLHDTPQRSLFSHTNRAYSHGCIRLHEPMKFAEALLMNDPDFSLSDVKALRGPKERWMNVKTQIPVHLVYFSAWQNEEGAFIYANDVYGYDKQVYELLGKTS